MYYLVVKNLGIEKCIDMNDEDIYINNGSYNCQQTLTLVKKVLVKKLKIRCTLMPGRLVNAKVYRG